MLCAQQTSDPGDWREGWGGAGRGGEGRGGEGRGGAGSGGARRGGEDREEGAFSINV